MKKLLSSFLALFFVLSISAFVPGCANNKESENSELTNIQLDEEETTVKTFPYIYIDIEEGKEVESKEISLSCIIQITNTDEQYVFSGENALTAEIRGRGNSTWLMPKKPYRIKFESKTDLFGFGKAKKYTLIANYCDKSLSRNLFAYELAKEIGLNETTSAQPVNLVVNGVYRGVYLLCEQNEIGKARVNIDSDLNDIDTGYLLELDSRAVEEGVLNVDYFEMGGNHYAIKDPGTDEDEFTEDHFNFIKTYLESCFSAINGTNYDAIKELIDVESFAKCYIVHELFNCVDVGMTSFYLYKNAGGKLFAGPVWDFDVSSGNCDYVNNANNVHYLYAKNANVWYRKLLAFDEFNDLVAELLQTSKEAINAKINELVEYQLEYIKNNEANFEVWPIMGIYVWPNPQELVEINTFEGQVLFLKNWLQQKLSYMEEIYSNE